MSEVDARTGLEERTSSTIAYHWCPVRFGADGTCLSPKTRERLLADAREGGYSDVFVFSHGWNNDWDDAEALYHEFIRQFHLHVTARGLGGREYRPLWVGIHWPSAILVLPWEADPAIATTADAGPGLDALLGRLPDARARRLRELGDRTALDAAEARELAGLLIEAVPESSDDEMPGLPLPGDPEDLVSAWRTGATEYEEVGDGEAGTADDAGDADDDPAAAGDLGILEWGRTLVRASTVWPMKDRAGVVGRVGVGPLLRDLHDAVAGSGAAVRLLGHSFGTKVVLSALCSPGCSGVKARSVLLLQPAISARSFAADAINGTSGGYRKALGQSDLPIVVTYSRRDRQLHDQFHKAVCRRYDIGDRDAVPAAVPVPLFAALGGYGPQRVAEEATWWDLLRPFGTYPAPAGQVSTRLIALDGGDGLINSHGDVKNASTAWAQYYLM